MKSTNINELFEKSNNRNIMYFGLHYYVYQFSFNYISRKNINILNKIINIIK